ncbi:MAG: hypothetical protein RIQ33_900 [Bacteroidota bacterium]|jgi:hypothetical protein
MIISHCINNDANAQFNQLDHDFKGHYFGITGAFNSSRFMYYYHADFITNDTILQISTKPGPGFNLGLMANKRLSKRIDIRTIPAMSFGEKNMIFKVHDFSTGKDSIAKFNIQNIYIDLPLQIKLKSDRVKDFRMYVISGMKYTYDLASLSKARKATNLIKLTPHDVSAELGFGFEFYFPMFILAPELKISQGLMNVLSPDSRLIFSRELDKLRSRTITISIHIEG